MIKKRVHKAFKILTLSFFMGLFGFSSLCQEIDPDYKIMVERKYEFPTISPDSASNILNQSNVVFFDTREPEEYNVSHLPRAILFGYDDPNWEAVDSIAKDKLVVVYCSIGVRSQNIAEELTEKGFKDVRNLYGGIFLWADQSREMVDGENNKTSKVHGYNRFWGRWVKNAETVYE
ncbi:MAG: rhodanese-like domain-containing protein [Brumimicrobium sp.]